MCTVYFITFSHVDSIHVILSKSNEIYAKEKRIRCVSVSFCLLPSIYTDSISAIWFYDGSSRRQLGNLNFISKWCKDLITHTSDKFDCRLHFGISSNTFAKWLPVILGEWARSWLKKTVLSALWAEFIDLVDSNVEPNSIYGNCPHRHGKKRSRTCHILCSCKFIVQFRRIK